MGKKKADQKTGKEILTFTVAECGEYHSLGKYYENIKTLDEAVNLYQQIPPERMNGVPSIGINLHVGGTDKMEDVQADILSGDEIDIGFINLIPELCGNPEVQAAVKMIIEKFPDKEVIEY